MAKRLAAMVVVLVLIMGGGEVIARLGMGPAPLPRSLEPTQPIPAPVPDVTRFADHQTYSGYSMSNPSYSTTNTGRVQE
ncbi:MAG: hypothetical protein AAF678_13480 [Pseudomonadota bacterium]